MVNTRGASNKKKDASGSKEGENDVMVFTYRDHHNTFARDAPNVTWINKAKEMTAPRRFLQFLFSAVMVHYFLWIIPMVGTLVFFYKIGMWYVSLALFLAYFRTFINNDQFKSGRPWNGFRQHPVWNLIGRYIGVEVVRTRALDPAKKYMFAMYPHGILILSRVAMYGGVWEKLFPGIETRVLGASPMFWLPGSREICLWMGAVDAARKVAQNIYDKYNLNLMVYPGGSDEIFETDPNSPKTTLIARKGFIKLAVQSGADLVPAYVFGEKWLYHRRPISEAVKKWFMKFLRLPLIVFWGRYFTWLPYHDSEKAFLTVVFGEPIAVTKQAEPSDEYINELWEVYIAQIQSIYETHKHKYGYPSDEVLLIKEAKSELRKKAKAAAAGTKKEQ